MEEKGEEKKEKEKRRKEKKKKEKETKERNEILFLKRNPRSLLLFFLWTICLCSIQIHFASILSLNRTKSCLYARLLIVQWSFLMLLH